MYSATHPHPAVKPRSAKAQLIAGRIITVLAGLIFLADGVSKLFMPAPVLQSMAQLGYPESQIVGIGILLIVCALLYLNPKTAVFGALLLTAYLGGATASHVRVGQGPFIAFPILMAVVAWAGIYLRDPRLHNVLPFRS